MSNRTVAVAMLGARRHYAVPRLLNDAGLLAGFFTDSYVGNKPLLRQFIGAIPAGWKRGSIARFAGRDCRELSASLVHSDERLGFWYWYSLNRARTTEAMERVQAEAARRLTCNIARRNFAEAGIVWGFNTASVELFVEAKKRGLRCILEQTYLPYVLESELMQREAEEWRGWGADFTPPNDFRLHIQREEQEWALADRIIGGSDFVADGLGRCGVPADRVRIVPYGVDESRFRPKPANATRAPGSRLRVLFVGEVGLRKGVPYLLEALALLGWSRVEARFAGHLALKPERLRHFANVATFLGPVPRLQMPELFRWADVFVLPSIVEGSATAVYEALLSGLPAVVTPNVGSIVRDGIDGRVVPVRSSEALAGALLDYAEDEAMLQSHAVAARNSVSRAGLERYRSDLAALVSEVSRL